LARGRERLMETWVGDRASIRWTSRDLAGLTSSYLILVHTVPKHHSASAEALPIVAKGPWHWHQFEAGSAESGVGRTCAERA
jgi:hypothetical protein